MTRFALEAAKWTLHYYDKYFGIKYPMAKLDMVAIPDFEEGAMENFGCITYRETEMLVDQRDGALEAKKEVATTVMHEMAHQWFGDLVTPAWWDNLWLNEGFATWMQTKAAAKWQPKWGFDQDVAMDKNHTLDEDAGRTTRAIRTKAGTPAEINELFDDIAYDKAGEVIAMVENWEGEEVFRKGVKAYLQGHEYCNATAEDFWNAQTQVSGQPVDKVLRSFVDLPGVPEIRLGSAAGSEATVTQRRFLLSEPDAEDEARLAETWTLPLCLKGTRCQIVDAQSQTLTAPASGFLYANAGDKGYYRTAYSADEMKAIVAQAETALTVPERIGLLGDQWALMRGGEGTVGDFLDLVLAVKQDANASVMESSLGKVGPIESQIATTGDRARLNAVVRREFAPVYTSLGGADKHESQEHADLRGALFEYLGRAGDPAVLAEAEEVTHALFSGQKPDDPMMADSAVMLAAATGNADMYERLVKVSRTATDPDVKEAALHAMARFDAPELVRRTLEYAVSDAVRSQDSWMLIAQLLERRQTQDEAWAFVQEHWAEVLSKSTENSGARIVEAAGSFCTVEQRDSVVSFFAAHPVESSARTLARTVDSINDCIHLRAAQEPKLRSWLDEHTAR
jgi:aminopeptidase N/puromycin-sensitive aminopeptidase